MGCEFEDLSLVPRTGARHGTGDRQILGGERISVLHVQELGLGVTTLVTTIPG